MEFNNNTGQPLSDPKNPWDGVIVRKAEPAPPTPEDETSIETIEPAEPEDQITEPVDPEIVADEPSPSEENEETESEETEINPYYFLSGKLKSDGFLLDDFEPTENITGLEVYDAYRKKLEQELEPRIKQQVYNQLESEGVTAEDLLLARAIRQGVDISLLNEVTMHEKFAGLNDSANENDKLNSIRAMYKSRNFTDKEISRLISDAEEDETVLEEYFNEAKSYHRTRWQHFQQEENERVARQQQQHQVQLEHAEKLVNKIFTSKEIMGEKMSDQETSLMREAIYTPSDIIEIGGQEYTVSKLYKFNYELENNPELRLWLLKKYLTKNVDLETVKKDIANKLEDDMLSAYEASVKKDLEARKKKELAQKLAETNPQKNKKETDDSKIRKSYYVEF